MHVLSLCALALQLARGVGVLLSLQPQGLKTESMSQAGRELTAL